MKLTALQRDLIAILAYILGTWACAVVYKWLPGGVPW